MTNILLLDIDDTIAPLLYRGSDAVQVDSWGVELSVPKYIIDWIKEFTVKNKVIWSTHRGSSAFIVSKSLNIKVNEALTFNKSKSKEYAWDKLSDIIIYAKDNPDKKILCADNDAWFVSKNNIALPPNLQFIVPTGSIGCLSKQDLKYITEYFK